MYAKSHSQGRRSQSLKWAHRTMAKVFNTVVALLMMQWVVVVRLSQQQQCIGWRTMARTRMQSQFDTKFEAGIHWWIVHANPFHCKQHVGARTKARQQQLGNQFCGLPMSAAEWIELNRSESNWIEIQLSSILVWHVLGRLHVTFVLKRSADGIISWSLDLQSTEYANCPLSDCQLLNRKWQKSNFGKQFALHKVGQNFCGLNKLSTCYSIQNKNEREKT